MPALPSLAALSKRFELLEAEVVELRERVEELEGAGDFGFEAVDEVPLQRPSSLRASSSIPSTRARGAVDPDRASVAREVGLFLRRCLSGEHRGTSGRSKVKVASSVYLVCQDWDRKAYNPPLVFHRWSEVRNLCTRNRDFGSSIFVGLPTDLEAVIAVEAAGLEIPEALLQD